MEVDEGMALIESAFEGVRVLCCPDCKGEGKLPLALDIICPRCEGCGVSTDRRDTDA